MAKVGVIGAGSWGTALAILLNENGNDVTSTVTGTSSGESNSYKVGIYTTGHTYSYAPAGTSVPAEANASVNGAVQGVIPIVQVSSSSDVPAGLANVNTQEATDTIRTLVDRLFPQPIPWKTE